MKTTLAATIFPFFLSALSACGGVGEVTGSVGFDGGVDGKIVTSDAHPADHTTTRCTPGHTISCACLGGTTGTQTCDVTGGAYGACACGGDAGTDGRAPPDSSFDAGCTNGASACLGAIPEECTAGMWVTSAACSGADPVCLHGACVQCAPSATRCSGGTPETCSDAGSWQPQAACACTEILCAGSCIDAQTDIHNCGACGHDCLGGACLLGVCQPATIASQQSAPFAVTVDDSYIYWTNRIANGSVVKMAKGAPDGGTVSTLASGLDFPAHIAVDTKNVYWTGVNQSGILDASSPTGAVLEVGLDGGTVVTLVSGLFAPDNVVAQGGEVFWDDWGNQSGPQNLGSVGRVPAGGGGTPVTLASSQWSPTGLAVSASALYWCNQSDPNPNDPVVFSLAAPFAPSTSVDLAFEPASGASNPVYVAIDSVNVYWTDFNYGMVMAVPLAGGTPVTLAMGEAPYGIATDGSSVYWSDWGNGTVMKIALNGGVITTLASEQDNPLTIAVDATRVYWASYNRGTVLSIAK